MESLEFIQFYENKQENKIISFEEFFNGPYFVQQISPKKHQIKYARDANEITKQARNEIFINFRLNECFMNESTFPIKVVKPFYELIKETSGDTITNDQGAQIILFLHMSKSNASWELNKKFFRTIKSLEIASPGDTFNDFYDEGYRLYQLIIKTDEIKNKIKCVVKDLTNKEPKDTFDNIEMVYFNTDLDGLEGFAGINQVFINIGALEAKMHSRRLSKYSNVEKIQIIKIDFTSTVVHELTHVILRATLDDLNASSPKINTSSTTVKSSKFIEAGIFTEKSIFKEVINWVKSAERGLNLEYCFDFLNKLLQNEECDFSLENAKVVVWDKEPLLMAIKYNEEEDPRIR